MVISHLLLDVWKISKFEIGRRRNLRYCNKENYDFDLDNSKVAVLLHFLGAVSRLDIVTQDKFIKIEYLNKDHILNL